jgi:hypothetical protein
MSAGTYLADMPLLPANDFPARARAQRLIDHLATLGGRTLGEFLDELGRREGVTAAIRRQLDNYAKLTPEMLQAVGADRWAPPPLHAIGGER